MRKVGLSLLAIAVSAALVGCGGSSGDNDDSNGSSSTAESSTTVVPQNGTFVDATVEGLYYQSGNMNGYTAAGTGQYSIDTDVAVVTFYLGGENGLEIGSLSARSVSTPFEAAGTYERSVNLARLLLTIDDTSDESLIVIPDVLKNVQAESDIANALKIIVLDDGQFENSVTNLLNELGLSTADIVSADQAIEHMNGSLSDLPRGSDSALTTWARGSNNVFVERRAIQRIRSGENSNYNLVIHADSTLGSDVFEQTAGLSSSTYVLRDDHFVTLAGSNDGNISGENAEQYLQCISDGGVFTRQENGTSQCNGSDITVNSPLTGAYQYNLTDPTAAITNDENDDWDYVEDTSGAKACMSQSNCTEQSLTRFQVIERDDSNAQDGSAMQTETLSGSYDPITGVYTQVRSKLEQNNGRVEESIEFMYQVDNADDDRYVDFIGNWKAIETMPGCGEVAEATWTFNTEGATVTGQELNGSGSNCRLSEINETVTYAELSDMDYWWFTTNNSGESLATLDQLNTTIRWDDSDEGQPMNAKVNRFSYIPAGPNWDMGTLVRDTLDDNGDKISTTTMRKIAR